MFTSCPYVSDSLRGPPSRPDSWSTGLQSRRVEWRECFFPPLLLWGQRVSSTPRRIENNRGRHPHEPFKARDTRTTAVRSVPKRISVGYRDRLPWFRASRFNSLTLHPLHRPLLFHYDPVLSTFYWLLLLLLYPRRELRGLKKSSRSRRM